MGVKPTIKLPRWKAYLYDLMNRIRIYRQINNHKISFGLDSGDGKIIWDLLIRFGKGGILRKTRTFILNEYVKTCEENIARLTKKEYKVAVKLSVIKKLRVEELIMEIKELIPFAEEVGMKKGDIKACDTAEDLVREIVSRIDYNREYSPAFGTFYNNLDAQKYFVSNKSKEEKTNTKEEEKEMSKVDLDALRDEIEDADDRDELIEILDNEDYEDLFEVKKLKKEKKYKKLKALMLEALESDESDDNGDEEEDDGNGDENGEVEAAIEEINAAEDLDDLKGILKDEDYEDIFEDISARGKIKFETLKAKMLAACGVESEEDEEELEVTPKLIKELVKAKDTDKLMEIAKGLDVKIGKFQQRSPKKIGEILIEKLSGAEENEEEVKKPKKEKKEKPAKKEKKKDSSDSLYSALEEMVDEDMDDSDIIKKVKKLLKVIHAEKDDE